MTQEKALHIITQLRAEKYVNAIQSIQEEILQLEVKSNPEIGDTCPERKKIKALSGLIEKIGEAALFGNEWEEGRRAQHSAITRLMKMSTSRQNRTAC